MTVRTPLAAAFALVLVAAAAPSASAQHVIYHTPVVHHQPVTYHTPVVYHQAVYTYGTPVVQSGQWNTGPTSIVQRFRNPPWAGEYADGLGFPFNNRPGLNIAYRLLTR